MQAAAIVRLFKGKGWKVLLEKEAKEVLEAAGIPTVPCYPVLDVEEACRQAEIVGFPVVLKLASARLLHKTEGGGVALNLKNKEELEAAYSELLANGRRHDPDVRLVLQRMAPPGVELIAGAAADPHFGTILMLGTGGVFAELFRDVVFRLPPLQDFDAREMIASLRSYPLLKGYRGGAEGDLAALQDALLCLSALVCHCPEIEELDINPLAVYPRGVLALDAKMVLR